jgi:hypothetical protein
VREWLAARQIPGDRAAYLGNDVNDLGPMGLVGWPVAVADAHPAVQQAARLVLARPGGYGAVRELCDLVIEYRQRAQPGVTATASSIGWQESSGESLDERPLARPHETAADHADAELSPLEPRFA